MVTTNDQIKRRLTATVVTWVLILIIKLSVNNVRHLAQKCIVKLYNVCCQICELCWLLVVKLYWINTIKQFMFTEV